MQDDRYLVKSICNKLLVFKDNKVDFYKYGYSEYVSKNSEKKVNTKKEVNEKKGQKENINNYNIKKEIQRIERKIDNYSKKIKELQKELYKKEIYMNITKSKEIESEINNFQKGIDLNTKIWEELIKKC